VFVMLPLRLRAGVRYIELYMVLYCICTLTCTPSLYGLYNERSPPLIRVCGVCPTLYSQLGIAGKSRVHFLYGVETIC